VTLILAHPGVSVERIVPLIQMQAIIEHKVTEPRLVDARCRAVGGHPPAVEVIQRLGLKHFLMLHDEGVLIRRCQLGNAAGD
jgi:hypothetical protein